MVSLTPRWIALYCIVAACLYGAAFVAGAAFDSHIVTRTVKVEKQYPTPDNVIDGAKINPALAGTTCSVYNALHTVVCQ